MMLEINEKGTRLVGHCFLSTVNSGHYPSFLMEDVVKLIFIQLYCILGELVYGFC